jgi:hypothetical protein
MLLGKRLGRGRGLGSAQVLHPSSFRCHTATSPSLAGRRTTGQKAVAAPSHRLRVTIHRGVALADPDYLPDSEAGGGCSSWCCGDACPGTYSECQVICTEFRALKRAYPTLCSDIFGDGSIAHYSMAADGPKVVRAAAAASSRSRPSLLVAREFRHSFWGNAFKGFSAQRK